MFNLHHLKPFFKSWKIILGLMILFLLAGCLGEKELRVAYRVLKTRVVNIALPFIFRPMWSTLPLPETQSHLDRKPNPWAACGFCRRRSYRPSNRSSCRSGLHCNYARSPCPVPGSRLGHTRLRSSLPSGVVPLLKSPRPECEKLSKVRSFTGPTRKPTLNWRKSNSAEPESVQVMKRR